MPPVLFALFAGFSPIPAGAELPDIAAALAGEAAIPGAAVGWATRETRALAVAGFRRVDATAEIAETDLWHIGSLTKSMTSVLAARLVEAGTLRWESTVADLLGRDHPAMASHWRDVTLEELLRHASGMQANPGLLQRLSLGSGSRPDYVAHMLSTAPAGPRGGFLYSNAGYVVAGAMLEAAAGAPWESLIATEVFGPLGLASAGFGPPMGDQPQGHRAGLLGGLVAVSPGPRADNPPALAPAGRVHLSAPDMLSYLQAHLVADPAYLSPESWARLHRAEGPGDYALGWVDVDGILRHSGSNTLWFAQMRLDQAGGRASFVAVNSGVQSRVRASVEAASDEVMADAAGHRGDD